MLVEKNKVVGIHYSISTNNNDIVYSTLGFDAEEFVQVSFSIVQKLQVKIEMKVFKKINIRQLSLQN